MIRQPIVYSGQYAERRYAADELARAVGTIQPSVADHWLWLRWMLRNGLWDRYHVWPGRAALGEQE